jgi:hypothetical protein
MGVLLNAEMAERYRDNVGMPPAFAHAARCRETAGRDPATIKLCGYPYLPV